MMIHIEFDDSKPIINAAYVVGHTDEELILVAEHTDDHYYMPCDIGEAFEAGDVMNLDDNPFIKRLDEADEEVKQRIEKALEEL